MRTITSFVPYVFFLFSVQNVVCDDETPVYGVDVSFPMHHSSVSNNYPWLPHNLDASIHTPDEYKDIPLQPLGDKQTFYDKLIQGCVNYFGKGGARCLDNEKERIEMALRQPKGVYNYTKLGYTKIKAPEAVFKLIKDFWEANKHSQQKEYLGIGSTYINQWESQTYMTNIADTSLGGGDILKQHIWNAARDTISEWTGQQVAECSLYGIRIYKEGSVLAPHVDRLPLVSSAIINVDQDVDEPWPLEVIGHDGVAVNITMEPGDLVLYESHSILHGRPFPLKGRFMANIFVHFEPLGPLGEDISIDTDLPKYIIRGSELEKKWRSENPKGYKLEKTIVVDQGFTTVHNASIYGDVDSIITLLEMDASLVNARDENGWTPLHEAVRTGMIQSITTLLEHGADIDARTVGRGGRQGGPTALWWALHYHGEDHDIFKLLKGRGAKLVGPDDRREL